MNKMEKYSVLRHFELGCSLVLLSPNTGKLRRAELAERAGRLVGLAVEKRRYRSQLQLLQNAGFAITDSILDGAKSNVFLSTKTFLHSYFIHSFNLLLFYLLLTKLILEK